MTDDELSAAYLARIRKIEPREGYPSRNHHLFMAAAIEASGILMAEKLIGDARAQGVPPSIADHADAIREAVEIAAGLMHAVIWIEIRKALAS